MRCGLMYNFSTTAGDYGSVRNVYAAQLEQIRTAEALGFDDLWMSEHHFADNCYLPSPMLMAAAVATMTSRIGIGVGVAPLPLYDPVRLAEECAVVDNLSGGRLKFGGGIGYRESEYDGYNVPKRDRGRIVRESLEVMRGCWGEDPLTYEGKHFGYSDVNVTPKPVQERIPLWLAGVAPAAVTRCARMADVFFSIGIDVATRALYTDALAVEGKDPAAAKVAALPFPWLMISEAPERDRAALLPYCFEELKVFSGWLAAAGMLPPEYVVTAPEHVEPIGLVTVITPDEAIARITAVHEATPLHEMVWIPNVRGAPMDIADRSLELFAAKVLPAVHALD